MTIFIVSVHVFVSIVLILIVLLQTGKGASMGAVFGSGSSQALFGPSGGTTFLSKATTAMAIIFMVTSLTLAVMSGSKPKSSVVLEAKSPVTEAATAQPAVPQPAETALPEAAE
ncbi:MAG: preprotein translocase subunit SecG [Deltaproteobacteria bacterium]|nr:MAG: preprotein translocase subunit SecG [Deltaproteobacteria bacterium]